MTLTNIISAIGNNNSIYPLLVRDCGIEVPTKVILTKKQNESNKEVAKLATRERLVDEYTTSAVWLGGIPLLERITNKIISKKGFNPAISVKLLKNSASNGENVQGLDYNIKKFKLSAPEAVNDLEFLKNNKAKYMKLLGGKVFAETAIPIALMGFVIPKLIFAWTAKTKREIAKKKAEAQNNANLNFGAKKYDSVDEFIAQNPSFKGNIISSMAEMSTVQKMAATDGGYAVGRVLTARNKTAAVDVSFKMAGMMFLNFVFPKMLANFLDKTTGKLIKTNLNLDIKMLDDKEFINAIKNKTLNLPTVKTGEELLEFADKNPKNLFVQYANKYGKIKLLENGVRDPRSYVDLKSLKDFRDSIAQIAQKACESGDISGFMKKAKYLKAANILANVGISSFLLAYGLPKAQFALRKLFLKCELEPGIAD